MKGPKFPINRFVNIKMNLGGKILKHLFIGGLFGVINELSYKFFQKPKQKEKEVELLNQKTEISKEKTEILFKKEEILQKIDVNFHLTQRNERYSEFMKNFLYGSLVVFLGLEFTKYLRRIKIIQHSSYLTQIILGIPIAIIPYYAFCSFYDRKSLKEFNVKLKNDFLPLGLTKLGFDLFQAGYAERIKKIAMKNSKSFQMWMRRATWMLVAFNTLWIFLLVSFYHERVSSKSL